MNENKTFGELIQGDKPVLVDFSATWCGPCKMMVPVLKELKEMVGDAALIIKIDVDKNAGTAAAYHIQGVPTLMIFRKGKMMWRRSGVVGAKELKSEIDKLLRAAA